jgi:hypothetical protein
MEDRRRISRNLLTFRWYLVSSVGVGAFEVARVVDHSILDLIPPVIVFFTGGGSDEGRKKELGTFCQNLIGNLSAYSLDERANELGESESENMHSGCPKSYNY